jgi:hypothetical protein
MAFLRVFQPHHPHSEIKYHIIASQDNISQFKVFARQLGI